MMYLISDLHLNHKNVIRYCNRPFSSMKEMNRRLINNWNSVVNYTDTVYFLGDFSFGKPSLWIKKLNGNIIFIRGNHDNFGYNHAEIEHDGYRFFLTHNPRWAEYDGWIIHGHVHDTRPLVDREKKRINVSCEMTNYRPISIEDIIDKSEVKLC